MEDAGMYNGHLVYFMNVLALGILVLWYFGIYFPRFDMLHQEKSGNPVGLSNAFTTGVDHVLFLTVGYQI
jgi:hypothetical protein